MIILLCQRILRGELNEGIKFHRLRVPSLVIFFAMGIMSGSDYASTIEFDANVFPSTIDGNPLIPEAMERIGSNDLIIVGHSGTQATAIGTDLKGNTKWEYSTPRLDDFPHAGVPEFRGIAVMADNTMYLCGNMPRAPLSTAPRAFVTHLDVMGRKISDIFLAPETKINDQLPLGEVTACAKWGDGLVLFGISSLLNPAQSQGTLPTVSEYFWLRYIDRNGRVKWERLIPQESYKYGLRNPFRIFGADMLFSATDGSKTTIFRFSIDGVNTARKVIPGAFSFVRESSSNQIVHLIGTGENITSMPPSPTRIIELDSNLEATAGGGINLPSVYGITYHISSGEFIVIGGKNQELGQRKTSAITLIKNRDEDARVFELPFSHSPFADGGGVIAAVTSDRPNEFIAARFLTRLEKDSESETSTPMGFKSGLVLNFFQFK